MLILLCGTDYGGKSALAAAIKAYWDGIATEPASLIHTGPPDPPDRCVYQEYELQLDAKANRILSPDHLIILDRWHLGDRIYGPKYRGFARYTEGGLLHTEMVLSSLGTVKVICSPPLEAVQERVKNRGDDYIDISDLPRIHAEYLNHGRDYGYSFLNGDEDKDGSGWLIPHLFSTAQYQAACAKELADVSAGTYTGAIWPGCILAGDELGGTPEAQRRYGGFTRPFTPASPATSSEWLMSALFKTGYRTSTGLVNVNHPGVDVEAIAELRSNAGWVALGARASSNLTGHGIPHERVTHPAFERRFRHSQHDDYAAALSRAIAKVTADAAFLAGRTRVQVSAVPSE
jgi:hypothetical protein